MIRFWPAPRLSHPKARGFSLLELMIVLVIIVIVLLIATPSLSNVIMRATLASQARELMAASILARSEAIKRNQVVTLCASSDGTSCTDDSWAKGWIVLAFNNQVLHQHKPLPDGYLLNSTLPRITFDASGMGASMASLALCRAQPLGNQQRVVSIGATGRPTISTHESTECSP